MRGQVTIFIIIGIILLLAVGFTVFLFSKNKGTLQIAKLPSKIQPVQDSIHECLRQIGTEGLVKLGQSGGYIDTNLLLANPLYSTDGNAAHFSPNAQPVVAFWWFMKSKDQCTESCVFDSKRPALKGRGSIESQLEDFINQNVGACVSQTKIPGCEISINQPSFDVDISEVITVQGKYPVQVRCEQQASQLDDFAVTLDLNLPEIYELASGITDLQAQENILEHATETILQTFSGVNAKLPPFRALEFSAPSPGSFWVKFEVLREIKRLLQSYIPAIQVFGTGNYEYIRAPPGIRDPELFEVLYNRQFLVPLNKTYPSLEASFRYADWWEPYFDLNCNGQLCQADSGSNFFLIPFSINRYEFAYDLSYPVLVEIRDPFALQGKGYAFQFFLEQNMRNSAPFGPSIKLSEPIEVSEPSIFCSPDQRTSAEIQLFARDAETLQGANDVSVSFQCGENNCNIGKTSNGTLLSRYPRCIGGTLYLTKPEYESAIIELDTHDEKSQNLSVVLEPVRTLTATVKNYEIKKFDKHSEWRFEQAAGLSRPKPGQETLIVFSRIGEPYSSVINIQGATSSELKIVPGKYNISSFGLLHQNIVFPPDERCFRVKKIPFGSDKKCRFIPQDPIVFNDTSPFPYGMSNYVYEFTPEMLKGAKSIEFRQFILAIDTTKEEDRIVEDLGELTKIQNYADENPALIYPVISK